jgi:hypothetical protein
VTFRCAKIARRGVVAIVQSDALTNNVEADRLITTLRNQFFRTTTPVVLMVQDPQFGPVYYGRAELLRYLEEVDMSKIPWKEYTLK